MKRYQHSILDVCEWLHGHATGSGDAMPDEDVSRYLQWLRWRIGDGWYVRPHSAYDEAVRALARAVLLEATA